MSKLAGKQIVLGVTGSIAAYKSADLLRRLQDAGATVRVVMTRAACEFITPLTMQTLSGFPVAIELLDDVQEATMGHITLARWADWIVIAPATADTLSRLVQGRADDLLGSMCLASESSLAIFPAMNNKMWTNSATQDNVETLKLRGIAVFEPASGEQACGELGAGRLQEPKDIVNALLHCVVPKTLQGKHIVITAGPTHEAIDPVRYIANRSSGKMGFAVAKAAVEAGATVSLIAGPVHLSTPFGVEQINVESALQMRDAVNEQLEKCDIFVGCAAVADYQLKQVAKQKIKKTAQTSLQLDLVPTVDIVSMVATTENKPFVVGFAAETEDVADYAQVKLKKKKLDMIAANQVGNNKGFAVDDNALDIFWAEGSTQLALAHKTQLARDLMNIIIEQYGIKNANDPT